MGFDLDDIFSSSALREASAQDDTEAMKAVSYDPELLFPNTKDGLWAATLMARAIQNMGIEARVLLSPVETRGYGSCIKMVMGTMPKRILSDIEDVLDQNASLYQASMPKGDRAPPYFHALIRNESRSEPLNPIMRERLQAVLRPDNGKRSDHNKAPM